MHPYLADKWLLPSPGCTGKFQHLPEEGWLSHDNLAVPKVNHIQPTYKHDIIIMIVCTPNWKRNQEHIYI